MRKLKIDDMQLVVFDLDGTLTQSREPLTGAMGELLCRLLEDHRVGVMTGGALAQMRRQFLDHLKCPPRLLKNLYLCPLSGSSLYSYSARRHEWQRAYHAVLPAAKKKRIRVALAAMQQYFPLPPSVGPRIDDRGSEMTFAALGREAPLRLKKTWDPDHRIRQRMKKFLAARLPGCEIEIGGTTSLDITATHINKAAGVKKLAARLHVPARHVLFVGDAIFPGGNDFPVTKSKVQTLRIKTPKDTAAVIRNLITKK